MTEKRKEVQVPKGKELWVWFGKYTGIAVAIRDQKEKPVDPPLSEMEGSWKKVQVMYG